MPQIRGERAYVARPATAYRVLATSLDLALAWIIICLLAMAAQLRADLGWVNLTVFVVIVGSFQLFRRLKGVATPGERTWEIRVSRETFPRVNLTQAYPLQSSTLMVSTFLTAFVIMLAFWTSYKALALSPIGMTAQAVELEAFLPEQAEGSEHFSVVPFYYSLGAWPNVFQGHPVFFNFPYEKGPPNRFAGQIQARWSMPDIRLTFEGPKTPVQSDQQPYPRDEVRQCLLSFWRSPATVLSCLRTREAVLGRHLNAEKNLRLGKPEIEWIHVGSKALPPNEQLQGFYLSATNAHRGQDRFVMITPRGTEQAFILDYPQSAEGAHARAVFRQAIRSLRVSDELSPGKIWIDQAIERTHLSELTHGSDSEIASGLAEIQAMLIARISVDPKLYDTYYHLGGTALLLAQEAVKTRGRNVHAADQAAEWLLVSKSLIESTWKYALDIAPNDPRTSQLHSMLIAAQKF
jgi:hypothetical protein